MYTNQQYQSTSVLGPSLPVQDLLLATVYFVLHLCLGHGAHYNKVKSIHAQIMVLIPLGDHIHSISLLMQHILAFELFACLTIQLCT